STIASFRLSAKSVQSLLRAPAKNDFDLAFATIVRNRVQRGGILAPGAGLMKRGENGRGLASRWYPDTLKKRILDIRRIKERITFVHGDGIKFLHDSAELDDAVFFIDPPYTVAGRRLYTHSHIDHERLFEVASDLRGAFLMTYDNAEPIRDLARRFRFETREIPMKSTHHAVMTELLVGRDLTWCDASSTGRSSGGFATRTPPS
ncbi:MAG: DNA adenine methylase, partial [Armatimonadota bacterium]